MASVAIFVEVSGDEDKKELQRFVVEQGNGIINAVYVRRDTGEMRYAVTLFNRSDAELLEELMSCDDAVVSLATLIEFGVCTPDGQFANPNKWERVE